MARVLVVEDDIQVASMLQTALSRENYSIDVIADGQAAASTVAAVDYDLLILDWGLPQVSGLEICRLIRERGNTTPVLMLTGRDTVYDKEAGLDAGADDYLTKPFHTRELLARVRSLLRRAAGATTNTLRAGSVTLDVRGARAKVNSQIVKLSSQETSVLEFLMRHKGQAFTAETLLARVWSIETEAGTDTVRQCIRRLRQKMDAPGTSEEQSVITRRSGFGYQINDSSPESGF